MNVHISDAPFYDQLAEAPPGVQCVWLPAGQTRIRVALWKSGSKGTVFMLPGRTECVEKYGRAAGEWIKRGYSLITVDWRGQGLSDRPLSDRRAGHVESFSEYQEDLEAMLTQAGRADLPKPYYMIAHSMGGAIGLRGLLRGLPFRAAAFSAPMWGISMALWLRPVAAVLTALARPMRFGTYYTPTTSSNCYVLSAPFEDNRLTTDREMWTYMRRPLETVPELTLGGPTMTWLGLAMREAAALVAAPAPKVPTICALGTLEKVVDLSPIQRRMANWVNGELVLYPGAAHELLMEVPSVRNRFLERAEALFEANR